LLRNTCVCSALASRASGGVAPCEGAVALAALRRREADRLRFLLGGNAKGFALSFPKQNSYPRVAGFAPLARARATIQLSLPLPSSPEGRAACRSQCGFQPEKEVRNV
jgi:hypothetical protein